jgi:hypothetical protein
LSTPSTWAIGRVGRDHAGVDPLLQALPGHPRHAEQLDPVAELPGEGDVERADVADALDVDRVERGRPPNASEARSVSLCAASIPSTSNEGSASA